jgi:hypothetical protein
MGASSGVWSRQAASEAVVCGAYRFLDVGQQHGDRC